MTELLGSPLLCSGLSGHESALTYADATTESERTDALRTLITQPAEGEHEVALELLLAAFEEKCSLDPIDDLRDSLQGFGMPDVLNFMLDRITELKPHT